MLDSSRVASSRPIKTTFLVLVLAVIGCVVFYQGTRQWAKTATTSDLSSEFNDAMTLSMADPMSNLELDENYVRNNFHIYVIVSPKRKEYIKKVLQGFGWDESTTLVDGVDKSSIVKPDMIKQGVLESIKSRFHAGRIAVALAHKKALDAFLADRNAKRALILEDDVMANPLLAHSPDAFIEKVMADTPSDWNYVNFGRCSDWCLSASPVKTSTDEVSKFVVKSQNPLCAHAYAVTRNGAEILSKNMFPMKKYLVHDKHVGELIREGKLTGYAAKDQILVQNKKMTGSIAMPDDLRESDPVCADWRDEVMAKYLGVDHAEKYGLSAYSGYSGYSGYRK